MVQFDRLGHVEVALFPKLKFFHTDKLKPSYIFNEAGDGNTYRKGMELPIQRLYYKFPKDFDVITYNDDEMLLLVRNGIFIGIGSIEKDRDITVPVYDKFGNRISAKTPEQLRTLKSEYERFKDGKIDSKEFAKQWLVIDELRLLNESFGRHIEMFREMYFQNDPFLPTFSMKFKEFLESHCDESIISEYKQWLGDESLISYKDIDSIVNLVKTDACIPEE